MFIAFPSIGQFNQAIRAVSMRATYAGKDESGEPIHDLSRPKPTLKYRGTTKLHGENSGVIRTPDGKLHFQTRNRNLGEMGNQSGMGTFFRQLPTEVWDYLFSGLIKLAGDKSITLFGEWCGAGVKSGVAIGTLEKFWYVMAAAIGDEGEERIWVDMATLASLPCSPEHRIYNALQKEFPRWEIDIDFSKPELIQNDLVEITLQVEKQCPVAKALGAEGIGEGVVWTCLTAGWTEMGFGFKCKGSEHSVTKVHTLAPVDIERVKGIHEFCDRVVTENRLKQGIDYLKEHELPLAEKSTGDFIRWLMGDILKEESDVLEASGLLPAEIGKPIGLKARTWYFEFLKQQKEAK